MDPTFPLVPTANLLACILVLASLSKSMFQAWNVGVCSFASWLVIGTLGVAINAIIWPDNVDNVAPAWCDLSESQSALLNILIFPSFLPSLDLE